MFKIKKNNLIKSQKGFTIAELVVAMIILIILIGVISTIFINVYLSFTESKRYSTATLYATQIAEKADQLLFEEVTKENLTYIDIPTGYDTQITIESNKENTIKTIHIYVNYKIGNNQKTVKLDKIKVRDYIEIPNAPIIQEGMVPVKYINDELEGYWVIASSNSTNWYNYYTNEWANVMLLDGLTTQSGKKVTDENKEELVGEKINTFGSMFVWIPRYAYKITNNTIEIEFLYGNTNNYLDIIKVVGTNEDGTEKIDYNQKIENISQKEGYKIHPSFTNGTNTNYTNGEWNTEIEGFWVAKYVAGFQNSTITYNENGEGSYPTLGDVIYSNKNYTSYNSSYIENALGQSLSSTTYTTQKLSYPVFKPLTYTYNLISTGDSYAISREIATAENFYGLDSTKTDSHMMKNSEWGAVAYLTHSKYGRNGEQPTANTKNLNNKDGKNIYAVTGYAGETANAVSASSTNNMSGIFDLNGCVFEYTPSYIASESISSNNYGESYATNIASSELSTVYPYNTSSNNSLNNWRMLTNYGDAIKETSLEENTQIKNWNGIIQTYPNNNTPFFLRGSYYAGNNDGILAFTASSGQPNINQGFRTVLINK